MSDLFDIYQENIKSIFGKVLKTLDNIQIYSNEKAETALVEADSHLKEADRIIKSMEIQSMTSDKKSGDTSVFIRNYKTALDQYKKRVVKAKENVANNKKMEALILTTDSSNGQKEKLIGGDNTMDQTQEIAWGSFQKLEQAKRTTIEMENAGIEICRDLHSQTEKMKGIGTKLTDMNKEITTSSGLLSRMLRLQRRNKLIIAFFSVGLIFTFLVILFVKLTGGSSNTSTTK